MDHLVNDGFEKSVNLNAKADVVSENGNAQRQGVNSTSIYTVSRPPDVEGWIRTDEGELALWVPRDYRAGIWMPNTELIIGSPTVGIDLRSSFYGTEWTKCYSPRPL